MQAFIFEKHGNADNLNLIDLPEPKPSDDQILVKVMSTSFNGSDKEMLQRSLFTAWLGGLLRSCSWILGSDISGILESVGENVTKFKVGDVVYSEMPGYCGGLAEYCSCKTGVSKRE